KVDYSFDPGTKATALVRPAAISGVAWQSANRVGMWVYGDGSDNMLMTRFMDDGGQVFQVKYAAMDWVGWRYIAVPLTGTGASFTGGASDGLVHGSIRLIAPLVVASKGSSGSAG